MNSVLALLQRIFKPYVAHKTDADAHSKHKSVDHEIIQESDESTVENRVHLGNLARSIVEDFESEDPDRMLAATRLYTEHFAASQDAVSFIPSIEQASAHLYFKWLNGQTSETIRRITDVISRVKLSVPQSNILSVVHALTLFENGDLVASESEFGTVPATYQLPPILDELRAKTMQQIEDEKVVNIAPPYRARLLLLDNAFPSKASSFRYGEFSNYLQYIPDSRYTARPDRNIFRYGEKSSFAQQVRTYVRENAIEPNRVRGFNSSEIQGSKVAYCVFLNLADLFFTQLGLQSVEHLIFTLYPGGGFAMHDKRSDAKLRKLCDDRRLAKIITTQKTTYDYLIKNGFCGPERILHIFGGVIPAAFESPFEANRKPNMNAPVNVCFVAHRYTAIAAEKGYDIFSEVVKTLSNSPRFHFHVVGNFDNSVIDLSETRNLTFHGTKNADFFPRFYSTMDIILSPATQMCEIDPSAPAYFDGFPTTCVIEAGLQGAAMLTTDFLGMNQHLDGTPIFSTTEMKIIDRNAPAIAGLLEECAADRVALAALGEAGSQALRREFSFEKQMDPRIALLDSYISV